MARQPTPVFDCVCVCVCVCSWGEDASATMNAAETWSTGNNCGTCAQTQTWNIPANRVSTLIFLSGSGSMSGSCCGGYGLRTAWLAFTAGTLALPTGLEYVDDMDTATGGWDK